MPVSDAKKSTIVRLTNFGLNAAERIAPGLAARWVSRQWFTLPPPLRLATPLEGGTPFAVSWEHGTVRGRSWGDGPVVYLVHGWGGQSDQFAALVEPLRRAGYMVVAFDAPSHGSSDPGAWGPTSTTGVEFGKALDAVFAKFGPGEAAIAHSMGGLATLLALNYGWFGVNRLVFVAPMAGYAEAMDVFQSTLGFGPRIRRRVDVRTWRRVGLDDDAFDVRNLWSRLDERPPALIVQDDADPQAPYEQSRALAEDIGAELMTTTRLGHNRVLADARVVDRIIRFLDAEERELTLPAA
jgi:pimeloyl-ACP methyl ester carboxylesterase